jgi:tRNA-splicing ligase RtcB
MKSRELQNLGIPKGEASRAALHAVGQAAKAGMKKAQLRRKVRDVAARPEDYADDPIWSELADILTAQSRARGSYEPRSAPAPWKQWGRDLDANAIEQLEHASMLPFAER